MRCASTSRRSRSSSTAARPSARAAAAAASNAARRAAKSAGWELPRLTADGLVELGSAAGDDDLGAVAAALSGDAAPGGAASAAPSS